MYTCPQLFEDAKKELQNNCQIWLEEALDDCPQSCNVALTEMVTCFPDRIGDLIELGNLIKPVKKYNINKPVNITESLRRKQEECAESNAESECGFQTDWLW